MVPTSGAGALTSGQVLWPVLMHNQLKFSQWATDHTVAALAKKGFTSPRKKENTSKGNNLIVAYNVACHVRK